ncbi:hypothetical protein RF11_15200 [Thelohanellus kitauei]|uniref:Uncharacterized protein n=1 Tax=Thelohanellus kitauei TaxID=669202 RepID=A0A0C2MZE4_THEKT|nr:hypothetical protein RF11_15200 [Thelohanellus kitauei]
MSEFSLSHFKCNELVYEKRVKVSSTVTSRKIIILANSREMDGNNLKDAQNTQNGKRDGLKTSLLNLQNSVLYMLSSFQKYKTNAFDRMYSNLIILTVFYEYIANNRHSVYFDFRPLLSDPNKSSSLDVRFPNYTSLALHFTGYSDGPTSISAMMLHTAIKSKIL